MALQRSKASKRREDIRNEYWPADDAWTSLDEKGFFMAPRTLPLILALLRSKNLSGNSDPSKVYVELLARHIDNGVVEMVHESEHAFAAGYSGHRAVRTWQDGVKILERTGFIKTKRVGTRIKFALLVHPTTAIQRLRDARKVPDDWWETYRGRQIEIGEVSYEKRTKEGQLDNVVPIAAPVRQGRH